ncbi:hypothetical protein Cgig2_028225 [Carnegiea gigantea]|uniref:Uncharacterized protein n=1 Tax=Carnegiea gigantea TaxID=171969 RepID=A0A9Q1GSD3_9CARY|nr:hypothetical protein Cgig2_028225 [Carnegiea gigantea]
MIRMQYHQLTASIPFPFYYPIFIGYLYNGIKVGIHGRPTPCELIGSFLKFVLMSSNSLTEPLSITNSENGDNENLNRISSVSDTSKSQTPYPVDGSRSDHTCIQTEKTRLSYAKMTTFGVGCSSNPSHPTISLTAYPPLRSSTPHSYPEIGNSSSPDLKANEPPCFGPPASPPVEHMEELITLCLSGKV